MSNTDQILAHSVILSRNDLIGNHLTIIDWLRDNFGPSEIGVSYWYAGSRNSDLAVEYSFANESDAIAFKLAWQNKSEVIYIDPPGGWKYGFPKVIPRDKLNDPQKWLAENGYPKSEIEQFTAHGSIVPYRCWAE